MYLGLKHAHSGLRWIVLILLLAAVINGLMKMNSGKDYSSTDRKIGTFALIFTHIQILIGAVLYFLSDKISYGEGWMANSSTRFYGMEHIVMMVLAAILITVGNSKVKRHDTAKGKFKTTWIFYGIGLLFILAAIPWPFRGLGGAWF